MNGRILTFAALTLMKGAVLSAQDTPTPPNPVLVEAIAPIIMAEDQRKFDSLLFVKSLQAPQPEVRTRALLALGRIGDKRATRLILPMLIDRDPHVIANAFFALGLLADTTAVAPILARLEMPDSLTIDGVGEAAAAIARIGGGPGARTLALVLRGQSRIPAKRIGPFRTQGLTEAWRLGNSAPFVEILGFVNDKGADLRYASVFSLSRLARTGATFPDYPAAGQALLSAVQDLHPLVQEIAIRSLTKPFADSAKLTAAQINPVLLKGFTAPRSGVRINALLAAGTWKDATLVGKVTPLLTDPILSVQVQAALTLTQLGGPAASKALDNALSRKDASWALKRTALVGLATIDKELFIKRASNWLRGIGSSTRPDWRDQAAALEGYGIVAPADPAVFVSALADTKPEVIAAALGAWHTARPNGDPALTAAAKLQLRNPNEQIRTIALNSLIGQVTIDDADAILAAWQLGTASKTLDDRLAVLDIIDSLVKTNSAGVVAALSDPSRQFFFVRPVDQMGMILRRHAELSWPLLAQRWGPSTPIDQNETGRSLDDYRGIVRTYVLTENNPRVTVDLGGAISFDIELLGHDAPLTVANFLRLVTSGYFNLNRWHRVVPNFVVQSGDASGTGEGGPGWVIRAEVNRWRYDNAMVGMADAGLDTGGSQWFINVSAQPHLDARYTIFGRVARGDLNKVFSKLGQGDQIRSIKVVVDEN